MDIFQLLAETSRLNATDLHIIVGMPPIIRREGKLIPFENVKLLSASQTQELVFATFSPSQKEYFLENKEIDFSIVTPSARFRVNAYYQRGTVAAAFRLIPTKIRTMEELGVPKVCYEFVRLKQGLILVTGPTGHGKSTTLASMINTINLTRAIHIVTIEDPIEYVYPAGLSIISQREMRTDTHSWHIALRSVLREDPDVVLVGEMRDLETIEATLTLAETGHLVFATLHTNSAAQTVDRIVGVFPEHQQVQIRLQLAAVLEGVVSQRLLPAVGGGLVVITETMMATSAVRSTIREGKTHMIDNIIQTSKEAGMFTLETSLAQAVKAGLITVETALIYALRTEELTRLLK